ncbi:MAG: glycosyltransferase [Actinobacteria bacterium]|nr:glycosyltransferase [Actinomycetota bacterium]
MRTKGSLATYVAYAERPIIRAASARIDLCVAACDSHGEAFRQMGCAPVIVCRNVPRRPRARPGLSPSIGTLALVYVGSLYPGRGLEVLIEGIAVCSELGVEVSVEITGWGDQRYIATLQEAAKARGVGHLVQFLGPCSAEEVPARYSRGAVACVLYEPVDDANDSLPSKLFEALAAGRVILASDLAEVKAVVSTFRCGVTTPLAPAALADALLYLSGLAPGDIASMADSSWRAATEELNWETEELPLYSWLSYNATGRRGAGRERYW